MQADKKQNETKDWQQSQDALAERAGLSVLLVEGHQPPALAVSNNNSICRVVQSSATHAERCEPFCGAAFERALKGGGAARYRCHAGLQCIAAPLDAGEKQLVAIIGRTFLKTSDYRDLTERIFLGDWQNLPAEQLFENVILSGSEQDLEQLAARLQNLNVEEKAALEQFAEATNAKAEPADDELLEEPVAFDKSFAEIETDDILEINPEVSVGRTSVELSEILILDDETDEIIVPVSPKQPTEIEKKAIEGLTEKMRQFAQQLHKQNYKRAVESVFEFLNDNFEIHQFAWLKNFNRSLVVFLTAGEWNFSPAQIKIGVDDSNLRSAFENYSALKLEREAGNQTIELFPLAVEGEEIGAAIAVGDTVEMDVRESLIAFCRQIALPLEFVNLREEVEKRMRLQTAVHRFNAELETVESENYLETLVVNAAELVDAERCSILVFDENENGLQTAVAFGARAEEIRNERENLGKRVANQVWRDERALLVADVKTIHLQPAPAEYDYKTDSFVSLPLKIGGRNIGVFSVTEKRDASAFDRNDLLILETIAPQLAFALDRTVLSRKAGEYEIASITDGLTGLLNRRYLEERLAEELRRSARHGYPMSFMMIDVDNFKRYNDAFGHQAGDEALRITARCLRAALRSADVAARYGGEEFSILLPQTTLSEAKLIAERIRRRVETTKFSHDRVTVSIGIAAYSQQYDSPQAVIEAADRALYDAKNNGKNNVQLS
jgi:diguanylate cyclase (GGDEF)-like protein